MTAPYSALLSLGNLVGYSLFTKLDHYAGICGPYLSMKIIQHLLFSVKNVKIRESDADMLRRG